jgi:hypothetical protein
MLTDPLRIPKSTSDGVSYPFGISGDDLRLIDSEMGKSIRIGTLADVSGKARLTISHSESKENKGQVTDRSSIRLEVTRVIEGSTTEVTAQVTVVASLPRAGFTADELSTIAGALFGFCVVDPADTTPESSNAVLADHTSALFQRVITGEP